MRHKGYQSRTLIGLDGLITIRRARFQCGKTGQMVFPLEELLDLPAGEITVSLAKRALRLSTMMSFTELQEELLAQHDVRVTDSTLDGLMQKVGGVAEADRQAALDQLTMLPRGRAREEAVAVERPAPRRLYVSCDGITYRTRYREADPQQRGAQRLLYQEMKTGAVFWEDDKGHWHKQTVNGRDNPERFGLSLWQVAVQCGMLTCPEVIFISDGGAWCNTVAESYFHDAVRILDWYHLSEHIWAAGRLLYPQQEKDASRWVHACLEHLYDSSGIGLLRHLERCRAMRSPKDAEALDALMDYLRPRLAITDYVDYLRHGYVIGSGMMESTCKQVVGRRLKGAGMQWSESGALAMTAIVAQRLNGTWNRFWTSRPMQRAA